MLSVGFFANGKYVDNDPDRMGIFYGGNGKQLGYQLYGMVVYFLWATVTSSIMFWSLNRLGWLRVSEEVERMGMDVHHHGGEAYPMQEEEDNKTGQAALQETAIPQTIPEDCIAMEEGAADSSMMQKQGSTGASSSSKNLRDSRRRPSDGGLRMRKTPSRRHSFVPDGAD